MQLGGSPSKTPVAFSLQNANPTHFLANVPANVWLGLLAIILTTLLAYSPVFSAGFIWDDDDYVCNNLHLHDLKGLAVIWFDPKATPQYYPLVHTSFWLEYHLWGLNPKGFHAVNVIIQILASLLLWRVLAGLRVPGAWLAAALFALHPVQVESVAWISERKNVLSTLLYLASALAYLRFAGLDELARKDGYRRFYYGIALVLFVAALCSKTVTCSLPAALGLILWWKKRRLDRVEILPLLPFFLTGLILGLHTAWLEKTHVGALGTEWSLTLLQRCLVAGRIPWFYASNLIFPFHLTFIYPRWVIDPMVWWQWFFPLGILALLTFLWMARHRIGREPLVAALFFIITLAPASGFINVYPMRFSFVADHFQYLASVGIIALAAAGLCRCPKWIPGVLLGLCGLLTWNQCAIYHDLETLWRDTLLKNPACWMAHTNLGRLLVEQGKIDEAETHYRAALAINSQIADTHYNYGNLLARTGRLDEAIDHYQTAIKLAPTLPDFHSNLGVILLKVHRTDAAITEDRQAVLLQPEVMRYHYNLANALLAAQQTNAALAEFQSALQLEPDSELAKRRLRALGAVVN